MRTITLSIITREHAHDFTDQRAPGTHPMDNVFQAALRFREYDMRVKRGRDLQRVALRLTGTLPNIGLEDEKPYDWERTYGIWGTYCCRESATPYCKRMFAIMLNADHADALKTDMTRVMGDLRDVIGALTAILTGCRENEHPTLETSWPGDEVTPAEDRTCVLLVLHVNSLDPCGEKPGWRILKNAAVTEHGVMIGDTEHIGFTELHRLFYTR